MSGLTRVVLASQLRSLTLRHVHLKGPNFEELKIPNKKSSLIANIISSVSSFFSIFSLSLSDAEYGLLNTVIDKSLLNSWIVFFLRPGSGSTDRRYSARSFWERERKKMGVRTFSKDDNNTRKFVCPAAEKMFKHNNFALMD